MVYAIYDRELKIVKIGVSNSPERRLAELERRYGKTLKIVKTIEGGQKEEAALHRRFRDWRIRGTEFFIISRELESWIEIPLVR